MALQECGLNLTRGLKELKPHGSLAFPCAGYSSHHTDKPEDAIPWHWHEELEIVYIESGQMTVKIPSQSFLLKSGDCIVINANVLHSAAAVPECQLHSLVFSPALITGKEEFVFATNYLLPLLSCREFSAYWSQGKSNNAVAGWFQDAFEALAGDQFGFEFIVRENLSRICLFLYQAYLPQIETQTLPLHSDAIRIRKMLSYIHKHFADNLTLADIAKEAGISERECLRCFQKNLQISPIQYLLKYRIMRGAEMLLSDPASRIAEIAALCGFDSQSNFSKMFKRFYNCTPREYKHTNAE